MKPPFPLGVQASSRSCGSYLTHSDILLHLPHRPPFLFLDDGLILTQGKSIQTTKQSWHWPASLLVEMLAQSVALLIQTSKEDIPSVPLMLIIQKFEFFSIPNPEALLLCHGTLLHINSTLGRFYGEIYGPDLLCKGELIGTTTHTHPDS